jgi:rare lipoprotein A (peptidoglycan hydrolase)
MAPKSKLRLKRSLHKLRPTHGALALMALMTAAAGLLVTASGSLALSLLSSKATSPAGYSRRTASWYWDDHHATACGFNANYGVANKKLPCGTHVRFWRAGHRVTAIVDDRGPYVVGRTWDLDEHTASALHFRRTGVGYVWAKW